MAELQTSKKTYTGSSGSSSWYISATYNWREYSDTQNELYVDAVLYLTRTTSWSDEEVRAKNVEITAVADGTTVASVTKSVTLPKNEIGTKKYIRAFEFTRRYNKGTSARTITLTIKGVKSSDANSKTAYGTTTGSVSLTIPKLQSWTVSYNSNGSTTAAPASQTKWYGTALTLRGAISRTGYTFSGWNTNNTGTGTNYAASAQYTANAGAMLYAKWTVNNYTISYNANGGTGTLSNQSKAYNASVTLYSGGFNPKKTTTNGVTTEYILSSWNTNAAGTGTTYALGATLAANTITANLSLFAKWTPKYIYPIIPKIDCYRTTETGTEPDDDGEYLILSFDWIGYSEDNGSTHLKPNCKVTVNEETPIILDLDDYTTTDGNGNHFSYKFAGTYSSDITHSVNVQLYDEAHDTRSTSKKITVSTAILPIDLKVKKADPDVPNDRNEVYMGVMHPAVEGQVLTLPNNTHIDGQFMIISHGESGKDCGFKSIRTDENTSVWSGVGSGGINHGIWSDKLGKWLIRGDATNVYVNQNIPMFVQSATATTNSYHSGTIYVWKFGKVVFFALSGSYSSLPNGVYTSLGTIPSGYRPPTTVYNRQIAAAGNAAGSGILLRIETSGAVSAYNYKRAAYSGNGYHSICYITNE